MALFPLNNLQESLQCFSRGHPFPGRLRVIGLLSEYEEGGFDFIYTGWENMPEH